MAPGAAIILEQTFGFVGLGLIVASWQFNARKTILLFNTAAFFFFFALGLYLLGATVGATMMLGAAALTIAAMWTNAPVVKAGLIALPALLGLTQVDRPFDYLPILAHVTGGIAFFSPTVTRMRLWSPVGTVLWGVYNFIVGAWGQLLADLFILSSMALGAYRHRKS